MNLDLFNEVINKVKESDLVQNFITELSNHLEKNEKGVNELENQQSNSNERYREEEGLYQVVDFSSNGVFLQNTNNNVVFEETNLTKDIMDKIGNDFILRYKDGKYIIEKELTDDFMNNMVGIQEYKKIQEEFIKKTNILEIDQNTRYNIQSRNKEYTILNYGENGNNIIKVPNELIPYFANEKMTLYYKDGKFEKYM